MRFRILNFKISNSISYEEISIVCSSVVLHGVGLGTTDET